MITQANRLLVVPLTLGAVLLAGCSGGTGTAPGGSSASAPPPYSGPAMPGVEAKPVWAVSSSAVVAAVAVGDSFAVLTGGQEKDDGTRGPASLSLVQATSGKILKTVPLNVAPYSVDAPTLTTAVVDGKPVAVAHFDASYQASGLQGKTDHYADVVVDASGGQVYASPAAHEQHLVGDYLVNGDQQPSGGILDGLGPQDGALAQTTSITNRTGTTVADFSQNPPDRLFTISGTVAVVSAEDDQDFTKLVRGLDLSRQGTQAWVAGANDEYLTAFDGKVLTEAENDPQATITVRTISSGQTIGSSTGKPFDCHVSTYDPASHLVLCASQRVASTPLTEVNLNTGTIVWQQPTTRTITTGPATHGFVYLQTHDNGTRFVVLTESNGSVAANNLSAAPIAITDGGVALVQYGGSVFGFRLTH